MSTWKDSGKTERVWVTDVLEPIHDYAVAALGSASAADDVLVELFEQILLRVPENRPRVKDDWFQAIDQAIILHTPSTSEKSKLGIDPTHGLASLFEDMTEEKALFLVTWQNACLTIEKGNC